MLEIINNLKPFFENCYMRIGIREYARLMKMSPPTASSLLKGYVKDGLLIAEKDRRYIMFRANQASKDFIMLSRIYWQQRLEGLVKLIEKGSPDSIVLFGSLSKGEAKPDSDIDLAVFGAKKTGLGDFERKIGRSIQEFWFDSLDEVKNMELRENIINGHMLSGSLRI